MQALDGAGVGRFQERARFHDNDLGVDIQVLQQLGLDVLSNDVGVGQVAADNVTVGDRRLEAIRKAGLGQEGACGFGVKLVPLVAGAAVGDGARGEMGGDFGAGRVEVIDNALAVDAHGDGLADKDVIERRESVVHAHVEDVEGRARQQLQVAVGRDGLEVIRGRVVDAVHRARLKLQQARGRLGLPTEDEGIGEGRLAPVVGVLGVDEFLAAVPALDDIGAGADGLLQQFARAAGGLQVLRRLDAERREGHLRREGRVGGAHGELDSHRVDGRDLLEQTGIALGVAVSRDDHEVAGRFFAAGHLCGYGFNCGGDLFDRRLDRRGQFGSRSFQGRRDLLDSCFDRGADLRCCALDRALNIAARSRTGGDEQSEDEKQPHHQ